MKRFKLAALGLSLALAVTAVPSYALAYSEDEDDDDVEFEMYTQSYPVDLNLDGEDDVIDVNVEKGKLTVTYDNTVQEYTLLKEKISKDVEITDCQFMHVGKTTLMAINYVDYNSKDMEEQGNLYYFTEKTGIFQKYRLNHDGSKYNGVKVGNSVNTNQNQSNSNKAVVIHRIIEML